MQHTQVVMRKKGWRSAIPSIAAVLVVAAGGLVMVATPVQAVQSFNNAGVADAGLAEVGTSRPTGWNQPGECIKSVQRWVAAAGGHFGGGGVISGYVNSGAQEVSLGSAVKGDVIQYTNANGNDQDWSRVHTMVVINNHGNGRFDIVQSNSPVGSGLVTRVNNMVPNPGSGWVSRVWRFGTVQSTPPASLSVETVLTTSTTSAGGLVVFARGTDNQLYNTWQTAPGSSWVSWQVATGGGDLSAPSVIYKGSNGAFTAFAINSSGNLVTSWQTSAGSAWVSWTVLSGGSVTVRGVPSVQIASTGGLVVFARGTDNQLYNTWQTAPGSSWVSWQVVVGGAVVG